VSEDNQWRQLGSIVNAVLSDAKTKATRRGALHGVASHLPSRHIIQIGEVLTNEKLGHGFLCPETQAACQPAQLELALGTVSLSQAGFASVRAPRNARLM
jgi:hypothetical protein